MESELVNELRARLFEDGFNFEPILDDNWHKIKDPIRGRYATRIFPNGVICTVMSWDEEFKKVYKVFENNYENGATSDVDSFVKKQIEETNQIKKEANEKAKLEALTIWNEQSLERDLADIDSPYLRAKGLGSKLFGARLDARTGTQLLVPCHDTNGTLWGIQRIYATGDKTFLKGQRKEGCFHLIGVPTNRLYIAEGFATGASVHLATGTAVAIAFDAGNLKRVARAFRQKYPQLEIIIAGDNDEKLTGQHAAEAAAKEVSGHFFYPRTTGKDWNDCLVEKGLEFLKTQFSVFEATLKPQPKKFDFHLQSLNEIYSLDLKEPTWIVDSLLPEVGISALFGKPKAGKSTLARDLMICIAQGEEFLGRKVTKGKVVYLAMEENLSHLREQLKKRGATGDNVLIHCSSFLPLNPIERLDQILSEVKDVKFVIFDTLFKIIRSKDEHAYQENMQLLEKLAQMAEKHKIHIMGIHHAKKGDHADGDAALGSTAITGAFDANIFLRLDENRHRIISSQHRYGEPFDKTILGFDKSQYKFSVAGSVRDKRDQDTRTKIWGSLRDAGVPLQITEISSNTNIPRRNILYLLEKDVRDGLIKCEGRGTKKEPKLYSLGETLLRPDANF